MSFSKPVARTEEGGWGGGSEPTRSGAAIWGMMDLICLHAGSLRSTEQPPQGEMRALAPPESTSMQEVKAEEGGGEGVEGGEERNVGRAPRAAALTRAPYAASAYAPAQSSLVSLIRKQPAPANRCGTPARNTSEAGGRGGGEGQ